MVGGRTGGCRAEEEGAGEGEGRNPDELLTEVALALQLGVALALRGGGRLARRPLLLLGRLALQLLPLRLRPHPLLLLLVHHHLLARRRAPPGTSHPCPGPAGTRRGKGAGSFKPLDLGAQLGELFALHELEPQLLPPSPRSHFPNGHQGTRTGAHGEHTHAARHGLARECRPLGVAKAATGEGVPGEKREAAATRHQRPRP